MIEWIVLVWTIANPLTGFGGGVVEAKIGRNPPQVFITSSTAQFQERWNSLSKEERESARVFKGYEKFVSIELTPGNSKRYPIHKCKLHEVDLERRAPNEWVCPLSGFVAAAKDDEEYQ